MITIIWIAAAIVIFIALLISSLILIARYQARLLHRRMTGVLQDVADREGLRLDELDFLMRRAIALDRSRDVLLYIDCNGPENIVQLFDCAEILRCRIVRSGSGSCEYRNGIRILGAASAQVGLCLALKNRTESLLQFYDEIKDGADERSQLDAKAVRWCGLLGRSAAPASIKKTT